MNSAFRFAMRLLSASLLLAFAGMAQAQSFRVQCPNATSMHPLQGGQPNPNIKCQQISGGDGFATMADGTPTYIFSFGPLSGLLDMKNGKPGTEPAAVFNQPYGFDPGAANPNDPAQSASNPNGAVGLDGDQNVFVDDGTGKNACATQNPAPAACMTGHVDPRTIMDVGVMNGNMPAPLMAIDEDDEFFLTLTNVGMVMRPDLFEQHTVHFHGYPNASAFYDGVPDASVAINIGGSFTYYYLAPDAGTYFWHCHITPPEHLQMGMVGQVYVRPRQNRVNGNLHDALAAYEPPANPALLSNAATKTAEYERLRKRCGDDILCGAPLPAPNGATNDGTKMYAYNDGDGSTRYDVEYPIQIHGFDPNFHFVGMTFNPEGFTDMKDKYFLLNGRSYPDTVSAGSMQTQTTDGASHFSQPLPSVINIPAGGRALLRISDLDVTEMQTLASLGIPMKVIALNARLLRDQAGNDMSYLSNSITLGGGESLDVILDASDTGTYKPGDTYYLYSPNLDHLSNDAENFGGLMTEVHICNTFDAGTKSCVN